MGAISIPGISSKEFKLPDEPKNRLNWSAYGETKTGKSSLPWLGDGGGPGVIFDLDRRLERVPAVTKAECERKGIRIVSIPFPKVDPVSRKKDDVAMREADAAWDKFLKLYDEALKSSSLKGGVRRISIDTSTELFDLRLIAEFGRLMGINPRDRGGANAEFIEVMRRVEHYDASVFWLHHAKEEWKNTVDENGKEKSMTTGNYILDGFKKANSVVQIVVQTSYDDRQRDPRKRHVVKMVRCGLNSMLNGMTFTSADWAVWDDSDKDAPPVVNYGPVAYISSLIVPDTEPEEWM